MKFRGEIHQRFCLHGSSARAKGTPVFCITSVATGVFAHAWMQFRAELNDPGVGCDDATAVAKRTQSSRFDR